METALAIKFVEWVAKNCTRIQNNICQYKNKFYLIDGEEPYDNLRSTKDLFRQFIKSVK